MEESLTESRSINDCTCRCIDRFAAHSGPDVIGCRLMRTLQHLIAVQEVVRWRNGAVRPRDPDRSGRVGSVAAELTANVEHDRITRVNHL